MLLRTLLLNKVLHSENCSNFVIFGTLRERLTVNFLDFTPLFPMRQIGAFRPLRRDRRMLWIHS